MDLAKHIQDIQTVLAPAAMFSNLANRFRALNQERRQLASRPDAGQTERLRLASLVDQIAHLMLRAQMVKNAILAAYAGIVCFMLTSVLIFFNVYADFTLWTVIIILFGAGLLSVLASAVFMIGETRLFYKVIALERKSG